MTRVDFPPSQSRVMAELVDNVRRLVQRVGVGGQLPSVLILGETGTGKTRLAELLHGMSSRKAGPFVDCRLESMPESLVESELFGYEKGAFTGAQQSRQGLFQTSSGGTLLLDEIGVAPPALQVKLLKAVEERLVRRVGGARAEPFDAWIISATNEDLTAAIRERRFREDLYHRLAVVTLRLPPLRERREDILLLARHFLERTAADYRLGRLAFTAAAEARIIAYAWPGNVRELANTIERAALLTESSVLDADAFEFLPAGTSGALPPAAPARAGEPDAAAASPLHEALRDRLQSTLDRHAGNISHAARELGIARNTLRGHIRRLNLRTAAPGTAPRPRGPRPALDEQAPKKDGGRGVTPPREVAATPVAGAGFRPRSLAWERHLVAFVNVTLEPPAQIIAPQLAPVLGELADKLEPFGGHIRDVRPLGLTTVFGIEPVDDLSRRAASAALAAQKVIERAAVGPLVGLAGRVAVHTAECLVTPARGAVGMDAADEAAARGALDALVAMAPAGAAVVSAAAARMLERRFELAPLPGGSGFRLTRQERSGLEVAGRRLTPFVGRAREIAALDDLLREAERGRGQVVGLLGEPGVGKTRLVKEFLQRLTRDRAATREGRCVPHGTTSPYHPLIEVLRQAFTIDDRDPEEVIAAKVRIGVAAVDLDVDEVVPFLLHLMGIASSGKALAGWSPEAIRRRTVDAIRRIALAGSRRRPLLIVVEDLQWIDRTSEETLSALAESVAASAIMLVTTFRPGYQPPWAGRSNVTQLALQPLNPDDSRFLVRSLAADDELAVRVSERILARAGGVPFFIEELTLALTEQPGLTADVMPDTIQATLAARLGRLAPSERVLLQTASVIGKEVSGPLLAAVAAVIDEPLRESLGRLEQAEFLFEIRSGPAAAYTFKHVLTQEAAYRSLPEDRRRVLHGRVAEAMQRLTSDAAERAPAVLAHHCTEAGLVPEAIGHWHRAAQHAIQRSANVEAIAHLTTGLRLLDTTPGGRERLQRELALRLTLNTAYAARHGYAAREVADTLARVRVLMDELGDSPELVPVRFGLWRFYTSRADFATAEHFATQILVAGERDGDADRLVPGHTALGITAFYRGRFTETRRHLREVQRLDDGSRGAREAAIYGQELGATTLGYLGWTETLLGYPDRGAAAADLSLERARAAKHPFTLALTLMTAGLVRAERREPGPTELAGEELRALSDQQGFGLFSAFGFSLAGYGRFLAGDVADGMSLMREGLEKYEAAQQRVGLRFRTLFAELLVEAGETEEALAALEALLRHAREHEEGGSLSEVFRIKAHALSDRRSHDSEVRALLSDAIDLALRQEAHLLALRAATSLVRFSPGSSACASASARLREIYARFDEGHDIADLARARAFIDATST